MSTTLFVFVALLVVTFGATIYLIVRDWNAAGERNRAAAEAETGPQLTTHPLAGDLTPPEGFTERFDWRFKNLVYQSGIDIAPEPAFLLMVFTGLLLGGGVFVWRDDLLAGCVGFLAGFVAPWLYYVYRRRERLKTIREQLPASMEMMSRAVRAGETLDQAVDGAGRTTENPLGVEWRRAARHLDLGLSVPAAMKSMTKRVPLMEMRILGTALNVQRRTGGNLGQTLDRLAHVIRDRLSYQRSFQAATGSSRMATILISLAGPAVFAYMMVFQPDYMSRFFELPGGLTLLGIAAVLQVVGLVWVYNLLRSDY
jgi:tight adherence protein B